ncbi:retinol dehydrogenase 16-like [Lingula anatina]|uniref:Retinol dehydrogenase 16-like n=1 Tax=Lingula anatina TaxID=7574 RepID=A0A1S3INH3_LINAN|nr:retinol dehydrogenase 16-like [Lingula anatina]|eukprot:XP_013399084.1 retinol dehydrogenase 16-like [Lingula anatina]
MDTGLSCMTLWPVATFIFIFVINRYMHKLRLSPRTYKDKFVLITGCDSGFGKITAKKLHEMGFNVFAACLTEKGVQELAGLSQQKGRLLPFLMDVSKTESIQQGYEFVSQHIPKGKGLWGLVNNAGISGGFGPPEFFTRATYQGALDVNTLGMIDVTLRFLPLLKQAKGRLVNMCSVMGRVCLPLCTPYAVSKFAVEAFSDGMRKHLKIWGVSVHVIEPGFFTTNLSDPARLSGEFDKIYDNAPPPAREEYGDIYVQEVKEVIVKDMERSSSPDIHLVRDAYITALTARFPYTRYHVGTDAHIFLFFLSFLPGAWEDWLHSFFNTIVLPGALR